VIESAPIVSLGGCHGSDGGSKAGSAFDCRTGSGAGAGIDCADDHGAASSNKPHAQSF
jgi:hypothetical protein